MFLAIINDTYAEVKLDVKSRKADFQIGDFFKTGVNNVKCFFGILDRYLVFVDLNWLSSTFDVD